ncbi:MAG TPA: hypothetical protein VIQ11_06510 [Mycobacterium sp.]
MKTFNADDWAPVRLVAPDGRTYTPGDHAEHRELLTLGYVVAPEPAPAPVAEPEPTLPPAGEPTPVAEPEPVPTPVAEPEPTPGPAGVTKPKTNRRNGGAL